MYTKEQENELWWEEYQKELAYIYAEREEQYQREFLAEFLPNVSFPWSREAIDRAGIYVRRHDSLTERCEDVPTVQPN